MSGKFMSVKRYIIPTITMVIIASQLMACAAMNQSELLQAINRGEQIEIEVAVPINQEDGTEASVSWTQLDQLSSQPELRKSMDDTFKIIPQGDSKNGVFYVNHEGKQDGNNTLYNVFTNSIFRNNYWNDESIQEKVTEAVAKNYTDIEFEDGHYDRAMLAAINAYFNILNDSEPGFANMDSTISRLEAMAAIFKAEYPVTDTLTEDADFNTAVGVDSSNEYAIFASNLSEQSFLSISSGSLDKLTAKGTITRGELAYILIQKYFADDYNKADIKAPCFKDAKNGGDIATAQKFIEKGNEKEGWQAYELTYALQNPDQGCPERMYKALVVAYNKGIITDTNCRWDEAVTKADFLEMLTNTYLALPVAISAERGTIDGYEAPADESTTENAVAGGSMGEMAPPEVQSEDYLIEDMEPTTMYATDTVSLREGPNTEDFSEQGTIWSGEAVSVIGVVKSYKGEECLWYRLNTGEFISSEYLSTEQPITEQPTTTQPVAEQPTTPTQDVQSQTQSESPLSDMTDQEIQDALNAAMSGNSGNTGLTTPDGRPKAVGVHDDGGIHMGDGNW